MQLLGEVRSRQDVHTGQAGAGKGKSARKRLVLAFRDVYENMGPLGPPAFILAVWLDGVSIFLLFYACIYFVFAATEVVYGLYHYRSILNVPRPSKAL